MAKQENRKYVTTVLQNVSDLERLSNEVLPAVEILDPLKVFDPVVEAGTPFVGQRGVVAIRPDGRREVVTVLGTRAPNPTSHLDVLDNVIRSLKERGIEDVTGTVMVDDLGTRLRAQIWVVDQDKRLREPHRVGLEVRNGYDDGICTVAGALQTLVCNNGLVVTRHVGQLMSEDDQQRRRTLNSVEDLSVCLPAMVASAWEALDDYVPKYDAWREAAKTVPLRDARSFLTKTLNLPASQALAVVELAGYLDEREDTSCGGLPSVVQVHDALTQSARDTLNNAGGAAQYDRMQETALRFREALPLTALVSDPAAPKPKATKTKN